MLNIKIPGHVTQMSLALYELQMRDEMCDLELCSGKNTLRLHKVVLAGMSDLALEKVRSGLDENGWCKLVVRACSASVLSSVVRCLYLGDLEMEKGIMREILPVVEDLGLTKMAAYLKCHPIMADTRVMRGCTQTRDKPPAGELSSGNSTVSDKVRSSQEVDPVIRHKARGRGRPRKELVNKHNGPVSETASKLDKDISNPATGRSTRVQCQPHDATVTEPGQAVESDRTALVVNVTVPAPRPVTTLTPDPKGTGDAVNVQRDKSHTASQMASLSWSESQNNDDTRRTALSGKPPSKNGRKRGQRVCYKCREEFVSAELCAAHRLECMAAFKKYSPRVVKALPYVCRRCLTRFRTQLECNQHRTVCMVKRQRIERKCRKCQVTFDDLELLAAHRKIHAAEWNKAYVRTKQVHRCNQCKFSCANEKSLLTHCSLKHNLPIEESDKHPIHKCEVAGCLFRTLFLFQLKNHRETHTSARPYICEVCGCSFKQRCVLHVHIRTVHSNLPHKCTECGKTLKTKLALQVHIKRVHQGEKRYDCPDCGYKAFDVISLESHRNCKHNIPYPADRKSYQCDVCGYVTRWKGQYDAHMRRHTGECPFQCKVCQKKFPAKSDLTSHAKWHVDKKNKCHYDKCKFSTCTPSKLKTHIRTVHTHRDEKPFMCEVCDYRTNLRSNLILHLRKVHKLTVKTKATRVTQLPTAKTSEQAASPTPTTSASHTASLQATTTPPAMPPKSTLSRDDTLILPTDNTDDEESMTLPVNCRLLRVKNIVGHDHNNEPNSDEYENRLNIAMPQNTRFAGQVPNQAQIETQSQMQSQTQSQTQGQLGEFGVGPLAVGGVAIADQMLASASRKPVVIQLKQSDGSVLTLQQLEQHLVRLQQGLVEGQQCLARGEPQLQVVNMQLQRPGLHNVVVSHGPQILASHTGGDAGVAGHKALQLTQPCHLQPHLEPHLREQQQILTVGQSDPNKVTGLLQEPVQFGYQDGGVDPNVEPISDVISSQQGDDVPMSPYTSIINIDTLGHSTSIQTDTNTFVTVDTDRFVTSDSEQFVTPNSVSEEATLALHAQLASLRNPPLSQL